MFGFVLYICNIIVRCKFVNCRSKSRKTKSDGHEKRNVLFEAKTKCASKILIEVLLLELFNQNISVIQRPFESCLNDAFFI